MYRRRDFMKDMINGVVFSSFIKGMGSLLEANPLSLNVTFDRLCFKNDTEALRSDWESIGKDLNKSINDYERNIRQTI